MLTVGICFSWCFKLKNPVFFSGFPGKSGNHGNPRSSGNGIPFRLFSNPWGFAKEVDFG